MSESAWQAAAAALWGPHYQTPLAEVAGVSLRTIQRGDRPGGRLPPGIQAWLDETMARVPPNERRAYGMALRAGRSCEAGPAALARALADIEADRLP